MFRNIGSTEIIIIALVILFLFGSKKLTEWAKGLGEAGRELKKVKYEFTEALAETDERLKEVKKPAKKRALSGKIKNEDV